MVPCDLVVNGFIFGSGDEFVEMEFWGCGGGVFCVLRVEFDSLETRGWEIPGLSIRSRFDAKPRARN